MIDIEKLEDLYCFIQEDRALNKHYSYFDKEDISLTNKEIKIMESRWDVTVSDDGNQWRIAL